MSETTYTEFTPDELEYGGQRDIRQHIVENIKENIEEQGFDPARPFRVVKENGALKVADGNHRLKAVRELGIEEPIPTHYEPDGDLYTIGVQSNRNEDTYAQMDLFDWLDHIEALRDDHTQAEIGDKLGWGRDRVAKYSRLLTNIVPKVLDLAREHQTGRGTADVPSGTFDFTEWWFRNSGIYHLEGQWSPPDGKKEKHAQMHFLEWFVQEENCDVGNRKLGNKTDDLEELEADVDELSQTVGLRDSRFD